MAKMRGFKPEIWTDDKFIELQPLARLLFMGMWNYACDNGHLDDKPKQIKMRILPTDNCNADELLVEIEQLGMIRRTDGVIFIPNLGHHQRLDKRYLTLCDHCEPVVHPSGARSEPIVHPTGSRVEGRKEGEKKEVERKGPRGKRGTKLPKNWKPTTEHLERASAANLVLGREVEKFKAHADENGRTAKNWNAAFTRWLINAEDYAGRDRSAANSRQLPDSREIEQPPDGLSPQEYAEWHAAMRARRKERAS